MQKLHLDILFFNEEPGDLDARFSNPGYTLNPSVFIILLVSGIHLDQNSMCGQHWILYL